MVWPWLTNVFIFVYEPFAFLSIMDLLFFLPPFHPFYPSLSQIIMFVSFSMRPAFVFLSSALSFFPLLFILFTFPRQSGKWLIFQDGNSYRGAFFFRKTIFVANSQIACFCTADQIISQMIYNLNFLFPAAHLLTDGVSMKRARIEKTVKVKVESKKRKNSIKGKRQRGVSREVTWI